MARVEFSADLSCAGAVNDDLGELRIQSSASWKAEPASIDVEQTAVVEHRHPDNTSRRSVARFASLPHSRTTISGMR